ncbi:hypothetical protein M514_03693 [Trichuris suis]|uniref:Disintegrin n=1 Tax=Trichuris suis TaxID=68888 RepID=A0A085MDQ7_9BILA|nr:hypothetical protein M513_03693 [Trichuris suis]KFD68677.1 hypothetical protein M514_03693 [Trichuris suis]
MRVSLVYAEVWMAENRIKKNNTVWVELDNFINFLADEYAGVPHDAALLLSTTQFNKTFTFSVAHSVCGERAAGIIEMAEKISTYQSSMLMAHTLGHMMGMSGTVRVDDGKTPVNITEHQYRYAAQYVYQFSNCSREEFLFWISAGNGHCLHNRPMQVQLCQSTAAYVSITLCFQKNPLSTCGNKRVDDGEQCDCGSADECESIDPCCVAHTCMLKADAKCSRGPCCDKCQVNMSLALTC